MSDRPDRFTARFGARLRAVRLARGLSQEQLADAAGLHRTHVSLIERDRRSARLETLERLAAALNVTPAHLLPDAPGGPATSGETDREAFDRLFPFVREYQRLATKHGIGDIFQDNGGKLLQTLLLLNLSATGRREGNDARDAEGREYELKTVNIDLTQAFSTHHHLNPVILRKYRAVHAWLFSLYRGIEIVEIFRMAPAQLETDFFAPWERKWHDRGGRDLNNPKISVRYVRTHGGLVYRDPVDGSL